MENMYWKLELLGEGLYVEAGSSEIGLCGEASAVEYGL